MEEKDNCREDPDDTESMLAKANSLATSLGADLDQLLIRGDKFCNDFLAWLKATRFDIDEALIAPDNLEKYFKKIDHRKEKNKIKADACKLDDFVRLKEAKLSQMNSKIYKTNVYVTKIEEMKKIGNTEICNLKKQHEKEINELTTLLQEDEDIIACLKGEKSCDDPNIQVPEECKEHIRKGLSY